MQAKAQCGLLPLHREVDSYGSTQGVCSAEMRFEELLFPACVGEAMYLGQSGAALLFSSQSERSFMNCTLQWAMSAYIYINTPLPTDPHESWLDPLGDNRASH